MADNRTSKQNHARMVWGSGVEMDTFQMSKILKVEFGSLDGHKDNPSAHDCARTDSDNWLKMPS